jgi:hypothetical protein
MYKVLCSEVVAFSRFSPGRKAAEARRLDELLGTNPVTVHGSTVLLKIGLYLLSVLF